MKLALGREPHRLDAKHPLIIEELLALAAARKAVAVSTMVEMLADVVAHKRGEKKLTFKMKRRKGYHKTIGHRQELTVVKITAINA